MFYLYFIVLFLSLLTFNVLPLYLKIQKSVLKFTNYKTGRYQSWRMF